MLDLVQGEILGGEAPAPRRPAARQANAANDGKSELNKFAQLVLKRLIDDAIEPTPDNFGVYFNKLLDERPHDFQRSVSELINTGETQSAATQQASLEKEIKLGFANIKNMLQVVALIFKNVSIMKGIVEKRLTEVKNNVNPIEIHTIIKAFSEELTRLNSLMQRHLDIINASYKDVDRIFRGIEEASVYDSKFDIYNKRFLLQTLQTELANVRKFKYNVSVMLIRVKDSVMSNLASLKDQNTLLKNISKILQKAVKKSDIAAYFGNSTFAVVMQHTNSDEAARAAQQIIERIYATSFFVLEREIEMDLEVGVTTIRATRSVEETLSGILDVLPRTGKKTKLFEAV